jgi:DNA-binding NtrC family response regulator
MVILVADDEVAVVDLLCKFLQRLGLDTKKATNGKEALEAFNRYKPEWVFLDVRMPDINGLELLKEMKKIDPHIKSIVITGSNNDSTRSQASALGASDYLIKPIDLDELRAIIKKYIPIKGAIKKK